MTITKMLYLVEIVSNIDCVFGIALLGVLIAVMATLVAWFVTLNEYEEELHKRINKGIKVALGKWWAFALLLTVNIIIPAKSTMYLMLGSTYLQSTNLPSKVSQALELKLDDVIDGFKKERKK